MDITQIRVFPVKEDKLKAFVSIIFDDCFVVSDIKIIDGINGLFVSMPSKKRRNGTFRDIAHPLNNETRKAIEEKVINRYHEVLEESGEHSESRVRDLDSERSRSVDREEQGDRGNLLEGGEQTWP